MLSFLKFKDNNWATNHFTRSFCCFIRSFNLIYNLHEYNPWDIKNLQYLANNYQFNFLSIHTKDIWKMEQNVNYKLVAR